MNRKSKSDTCLPKPDLLKETRESLRRTEEKYRCLVESLDRDYIIYSHDAQGRFTYLSPSIVNVLGYTPKEFMGHYSEYMSDSPLNQRAMEHTNAALTGEKQDPYEAEFFHKDGRRIQLRTTEVPIFDKTGAVISIEGIVQDITKQKQAEAEREALIRDLERALKEVKTLSGLLPICSRCKKIRDDEGQWLSLDAYVEDNTEVFFTHSYCPVCYQAELDNIQQMAE